MLSSKNLILLLPCLVNAALLTKDCLAKPEHQFSLSSDVNIDAYTYIVTGYTDPGCGGTGQTHMVGNPTRPCVDWNKDDLPTTSFRFWGSDQKKLCVYGAISGCSSSTFMLESVGDKALTCQDLPNGSASISYQLVGKGDKCPCRWKENSFVYFFTKMYPVLSLHRDRVACKIHLDSGVLEGFVSYCAKIAKAWRSHVFSSTATSKGTVEREKVLRTADDTNGISAAH